MPEIGRQTSVSIVICCFNSAQRLPDTLARLLEQVNDESISWEVIVVDNASTDDTAIMARHVWPTEFRAPLRIVREPDPGLTHARRAGLTAARGEIVSFVDDDNRVCADWVRFVHEIFARHSDVGACGGLALADFAAREPSWFKAVQRFYACGPQAPCEGFVDDRRGYLYGAGLSVRRQALARLYDLGFQNLASDRTGASLSSGGDVEICLALRLGGWRLYYDPQLELNHLMPAERTTDRYRRRLIFAIGRSELCLGLYRMVLQDRYSKRVIDPPPGQWLRECLWTGLALWGTFRHCLAARSFHSENQVALLYQAGKFWGIVSSPKYYVKARQRIRTLTETLATVVQ